MIHQCPVCGSPAHALCGGPQDDPNHQYIEHLIDCWHNGEGEGLELHEFLGMTFEEYIHWLTRR